MDRIINAESMKELIILAIIIFTCLIGCDDVKVGYLRTYNAKYVPDSLVVKNQLDPGNKDDARREQFRIPWQSVKIEGVQGTMPIRYEIQSINAGDLDQTIREQFRIKDGGVIELQWDHTVPVGRYIISVNVSNEGHVEILDSLFTVIVK